MTPKRNYSVKYFYLPMQNTKAEKVGLMHVHLTAKEQFQCRVHSRIETKLQFAYSTQKIQTFSETETQPQFMRNMKKFRQMAQQ
ncbi:hypothetical protein GDO78_004231 [Eleutherodactylus coqui]|uniref:Uncharacterized protein n=1 Tax=Eleutherodactylus coqui TaxID=57060 RepID=A0A8J6ER40_ELECQ|nr:hypothetical protein GDO78_004231 [Eleutherodactylus coqui]